MKYFTLENTLAALTISGVAAVSGLEVINDPVKLVVAGELYSSYLISKSASDDVGPRGPGIMERIESMYQRFAYKNLTFALQL